MSVVKISVINGTAYVDRLPRGIAVEVTDYDVHPKSKGRDKSGRPCCRYRVTEDTLRKVA